MSLCCYAVAVIDSNSLTLNLPEPWTTLAERSIKNACEPQPSLGDAIVWLPPRGPFPYEQQALVTTELTKGHCSSVFDGATAFRQRRVDSYWYGPGFKDSHGRVNAKQEPEEVHKVQNRCEVLFKNFPNASDPEDQRCAAARSKEKHCMYTYNSHTWKSTEDNMKWES